MDALVNGRVRRLFIVARVGIEHGVGSRCLAPMEVLDFRNGAYPGVAPEGLIAIAPIGPLRPLRSLWPVS